MDLTNKFAELKSFLLKHQELYAIEDMDQYPFSQDNIYHQWAEALSVLNNEEKISFTNDGHVPKYVHETLTNFMLEIQSLKQIPFHKSDFKLSYHLRRISEKKQHEIEAIIDLIKKNQKIFSHVIDIGSGMGHLSQALLTEFSKLRAISIDQNQDLQLSGKKTILKWNPSIITRLEYKHQKIETKKNIITSEPSTSLLLGLHTCGPLAYHILNVFNQNKYQGFLNFACCYHQLKHEYNISNLAKKNPLIFSYEALTLASKCHVPLDKVSFMAREKIKSYRYALHFFISDNKITPKKSIGNINIQDLDFSFGHFCHQYAPITQIYTKSVLDNYFNNPTTQVKLTKAMALGLIRSHMGRLIEIYLAYDRVLFLQENGYNAKILQFFNPYLSPRNIGIYIL